MASGSLGGALSSSTSSTRSVVGSACPLASGEALISVVALPPLIRYAIRFMNAFPACSLLSRPSCPWPSASLAEELILPAALSSWSAIIVRDGSHSAAGVSPTLTVDDGEAEGIGSLKSSFSSGSSTKQSWSVHVVRLS